jgi:hypothetical protein
VTTTPRKDGKVLKLGVSEAELAAFVRAHHELGTPSLSRTLGELLRFYANHKGTTA